MPPRLKAALLTFLAVLLWGFAPIGGRYLLGDNHEALPPVPYIALRYGIATLCFLPALLQAMKSWDKRDWLLGALCGLLGVTGYNLPNAFANRTVSAGMCGLLNATEPLLIVLLIALRAQRLPGKWTFIAASLGFAGIVLLALSAGKAEGDALGIALNLIGALNWSGYCVLVPPLLAARGAVQTSAVTMFFGTLPMVILGLPGMGHLVATIGGTEWEIILALAIGTSFIAMVAWNAGANVLGAEASGWFLYLLPVVSAAGGAVILGEPVTFFEYIGGAMILLSVFLSQKAPKTA